MATRYLLIAALPAALAFAVATQTGQASEDRLPRIAELRAGDSVRVKTLDLFCTVHGRDPSKTESGPVLYCDRESTELTKPNSAELLVSKYRFRISKTGSPYGNRHWNYYANRTP